MKLSYLIDFLQQLETIPVSGIQTANERKLQELTIKVCNHPVIKFDDFCSELHAGKIALNQQFDNINQTIANLCQHVRQLIANLDIEYRARSLKWFQEEESRYATVPAILDRRLPMPDKVRRLLTASVCKSQDWRWPGMIIRPGRESFVNDMVALDPLYMLDTNLDLLHPAMDSFHPNFQSRVRCYRIQEELGAPILQQLPQAQIGFCFAFYYFNFRPIELIFQWLDEIWQVLRPGGRLLFTYNDCDQPHGVGLFEASFSAYTPGSAIRAHAEKLGFELIEEFRAPADVVWIDLRKPGVLSSIRGSQALAKLVYKSK